MVDYGTLSIVLTGIGLIVAIIYYSLQIRNQNTTRQAQLFMPIYARFNQKEFMKQFSDITNVWEWKDYDDFNEQYGPNNNPEDYASFLVIITYFEGVGVLVKRGLINADFVDDLLSGLIIRLWEKYETYIISLRKIRQWPQFAEYVEYLYNEIKIIMEIQHPELKT